MSEELSLSVDNLGYTPKSDENNEFLIAKLKTQLNNYKKLSNINEQILNKIKLKPDSLSSHCRNTLNNLSQLQEIAKINSLTSIDLALSYQENEHKKYKIKKRRDEINSCRINLWKQIDDTNNNIEKLKKDISFASSQIDKLYHVSQEKNLSKLVESYKEKIAVIQKSNNWIDQPEYDVRNIQQEIKNAITVEEEKSKLKDKIKFYENLKPDITLAKHQLSQIKSEYESNKSNLII